MPDPWEPIYEKYKEEFEKYSVNETTVLIGHSCGCAFLVHWLGEKKKKVNHPTASFCLRANPPTGGVGHLTTA